MDRRVILVPVLILALALLLAPRFERGEIASAGPLAATPVGAGFIYQGQLKQNGTAQPATLAVTNGLYSVTLNPNGTPFGATAFQGDARWLEIKVGCPSGSALTLLSPREPLAAVPYALALPGFSTQPNATSPNVVGGFSSNIVKAAVVGATIAGGGTASSPNQSNADYATVGGGVNNQATGRGSTVPGGDTNEATAQWSFAAGHLAHATDEGSFVWSDGSRDGRSQGKGDFNVTSIGVHFWYDANGNNCSVTSPAGWNCPASDRNVKANFAPVDGRAVLELLATLPVETWNYKSDDPAIRHIGPMAQDFYATFALGEDETRLSSVDGQGVALAAIQGLYALAKEKDAEIAALAAEKDAQVAALEQHDAAQQAELGMLQEQVASLAARLAALEVPVGDPHDAAD